MREPLVDRQGLSVLPASGEPTPAVSHIPEPARFYLSGPDLVIGWANARMRRSFTRPLVGRPIREVFPEPDFDGAIEEMRHALASGRPMVKVRRLWKPLLDREATEPNPLGSLAIEPVRGSADPAAPAVGLLVGWVTLDQVSDLDLIKQVRLAAATGVADAHLRRSWPLRSPGEPPLARSA